MKKGNESNQIVRQCLTEALLILLRTKKLEDITITELVEKAGVGRVSFYRNFGSKQEIVLDYLVQQTVDWWASVLAEKEPDIILRLFQLFEGMKPTIQMLYDCEIPYVLYEFIRRCQFIGAGTGRAEAYALSRKAGAVFGWCDEWIRGGMKESSEEMAALIHAPAKDSWHPSSGI